MDRWLRAGPARAHTVPSPSCSDSAILTADCSSNRGNIIYSGDTGAATSEAVCYLVLNSRNWSCNPAGNAQDPLTACWDKVRRFLFFVDSWCLNRCVFFLLLLTYIVLAAPGSDAIARSYSASSSAQLTVFFLALEEICDVDAVELHFTARADCCSFSFGCGDHLDVLQLQCTNAK